MYKCFMIIDFSTRHVQANLVDITSGQLFDSKVSTYELIHENPGWNEINSNDIWSSLQQVVKEIIQDNEEKYEIDAIGFSWFGDNLILTDEKGEPLDNLILSFDYRAKEEAQKIIDEYGEERLFNLIGKEPVSAGLIPAKLLWYKLRKPEVYDKAKLLLNLQQFILLKLGLGAVTDYSLACRKNMFDIKNLSWSESLCGYLGISVDQLGEDFFPANTILGTINKIGEVKLPNDIPVLLGAHNSISGMIGLGSLPNLSPILTEVVGNFDIIGFLSDRFFEKHAGFFDCYCGPFKDSFVVAGSTIIQTDLNWVMKVLYEEKETLLFAEKLSKCLLDGRNHVILSKGIQTGEGVIRGLSLNTTKEDILQAILEGVTFPLISIINQQSRINNRVTGEPFKSIRCGGRGATYDRLLQLKADIYNINVERTANSNVSALGAAIMLAVEMGHSPDYETVVSQMIHIEKTFEPRPEIAERYKERYVDFLEIK